MSGINTRSAQIAAMIVVTLLCLIYVDAVILRPLTRLIRMSGNAVTGKARLRLPWLQRGDEIGTLSRSLAKFQESTSSLVRNQKLATAKNTILQRALANEERLNNFQKTFRSMATHEFRTLLSVIDGHAQRLLNPRNEETDSRPRYTKIREAVAKLKAEVETQWRADETAAKLASKARELSERLDKGESADAAAASAPSTTVAEPSGTRASATA